ncbi:MAG TPA: AraC family transcriptional regulator [Candidatus Lachnoclostridium avicola]|nr:AraC family transcriptional regulator [Candidatus Lachnoclostridium avicola]
MEKQDLEIMGGNSEVVHYERQGLPLYIRTADLEQFTGKRAACHWHDDLEWIHILDGTMNYSVNGRKLPLKVGDSLLVNGRQMHYGYGEGGCRFLCILFHPSLFGDNQVLRQEYVRPVLENPALEYLYFDGEEEEGRKTGKALRRMAEFKEAGEMAYEMDVIGWMCLLWAEILRKTDVGGGVCPAGEREDRAAQKEMVSFICRHYGEPLSLEAIAAAGHVSRSKCCQIFRKYVGQSPVEFLNAYRLKVGRNLLRDTERNVTEIATVCGFSHLSYFSRQFAAAYGRTPREYRRGAKKCEK